MILLILGRGKTGALVAEVARQRGHQVRVLGSADNRNGAGLTPQASMATDSRSPDTRPSIIRTPVRKAMGIVRLRAAGSRVSRSTPTVGSDTPLASRSLAVSRVGWTASTNVKMPSARKNGAKHWRIR